jgi:deoxyribose-phosphate aldolase
MDTRDLVARITDEVVRRLRQEGMLLEGGEAALGPLPVFRDCEVCGTRGECVRECPSSVQFYVDVLGCDRVSTLPGALPHNPGVAGTIDHTLLKPDATEEQVVRLCEEARAHEFASVCINPCWVRLAARILAASPVKVCTVVGFPLGANTPEIKALETRRAVADGAQEIDMVMNIGAMRSGDYETVERDIRGVVEECRGPVLSKVILETALLDDDQKVKACVLAQGAGADFVKTSTGFASKGATVKDVRLMRETVGRRLGVKAAGGIRDYSTALEMLEAGATRIGASASVMIVESAKEGGSSQAAAALGAGGSDRY